MNRILLGVCALIVVSCAKQEVGDLTPQGAYPLTFGVGMDAMDDEDGIDSRAGHDGVKSFWDANDMVGVSFNAGNANLQFSQVAGSLAADGTSVSYSGVLNNPVTGVVTATAYYPYSSSATASNTVVATKFPVQQSYGAGWYREIPLFAKYTGDISNVRFQFQNLFSVIKLSLSKSVLITEPVKLTQIVFTGNNNEPIAGSMQVNMAAAQPVVTYVGGEHYIVLNCGADVELTTTPKNFYIAIPSIDYSNGYTINCVTDKGQFTKSAKSLGANYLQNHLYKTTPLVLDVLEPLTAMLDENLRNALKALGLITVINAELGIVVPTGLGRVTTSIDLSNKSIVSISGLEIFKNLTTITLSNNAITNADFTKMPQLQSIAIDGNALVTLNISGLKSLSSLQLIPNVNSIQNLVLTIPAAVTIQNFIADNATSLSSWTSLVVSNNNNIKSISLKNNSGMLLVTVTNNTKLTSLDVTGSGLVLAKIISLGNALAFNIIGMIL